MENELVYLLVACLVESRTISAANDWDRWGSFLLERSCSEYGNKANRKKGELFKLEHYPVLRIFRPLHRWFTTT